MYSVGFCAIEYYISFVFTIITFRIVENRRLNQYKITLDTDVHDILKNLKTIIKVNITMLRAKNSILKHIISY